MDKFRRAEEQSRDVAHRGLEKARESWDDAERRLRRKMRLHPGSDNPAAPAREPAQPPVPSSQKEVADSTLPKRASEEEAA